MIDIYYLCAHAWLALSEVFESLARRCLLINQFCNLQAKRCIKMMEDRP